MPTRSHAHAPTTCRAAQWFLDEIRKEPLLELVGVHSHLGSTITKVSGVWGGGAQATVATMDCVQNKQGEEGMCLVMGEGHGVWRSTVAGRSAPYTRGVGTSLK